jgi:hypothetical protein
MKLKHNEIKREDLQNYIIDFPIILYIVTEYTINMHGHTIKASCITSLFVKKKITKLRLERRDCTDLQQLIIYR